MPDPFATALTVLFNGARAVAAVYIPASGIPVPVRVIRHRFSQEQRHSFGTAMRDGDMVKIRCSDVALPATGDTIEIGDDTLTVLAAPQLDAEGVTWTLQVQ